MSSTELHDLPSPAQAPAGALPERPGRTGFALAAALIAVLTVLAYSNTLHSPFVFDDNVQIERNPVVRDLSLFWAPWRIDEVGLPADHVAGFRTRYVAYLTFALDFRLHGANVLGYHLTNLAIHLAAALTLLAAVRRALELPRFDGSRLRGREIPVAGLVAALFALHPLQTQAVTYTVQRMASLAGLFCIVALWAHLRGRVERERGRQTWFALAIGLALVAAFFTKQTAYLFPLILILVDLVLFPGPWRTRRRWLAVPLLLLGAVVLLGLRLWATGGESEATRVARGGTVSTAATGAEQAIAGISAWDYRRTQVRVLTTYLRLWFLPVRQNLDYDYPISRSWLEPRLLGSAALLAALAGAAVWLLARRRGGDPGWRLVGLGLAWFFVAHAVESSGLELLDPIFEHRMYLPSVGLSLALVVTVALGVPERRGALALSTLAAGAVVLACATWARNEVWRSELRLWQDVLAKSPDKVRALAGVAERLLELRRVEEAERHLLRAHEIEPRQVSVLVQLGVVARIKGESERAERYLRQAIEIQPNHWVALLNLGDLALARGERESAEALYERAARNEELSSIARKRLERLRTAPSTTDAGTSGASATEVR